MFVHGSVNLDGDTRDGPPSDPDGDYVRRLVPELAGLQGASIHAPSQLGPLELASADVILGETYPYPIVEHRTARERAMAAYAVAKNTASGARPH